MKATTLLLLLLLTLLALALPAVLGAPFFPEESGQADVDADSDAEFRTHGLIRRKKMKKQQLLCYALQGLGGGGGGRADVQGRTFDLLTLGLSQQQPSNGLCGPHQGGGGGGPPVSSGGAGGGPPAGGGGLGSLPGGLLGEGQEILSSVVGLVGAVSQAGGGLLGGVRPQRYLRPAYRAIRPYYRFF